MLLGSPRVARELQSWLRFLPSVETGEGAEAGRGSPSARGSPGRVSPAAFPDTLPPQNDAPGRGDTHCEDERLSGMGRKAVGGQKAVGCERGGHGEMLLTELPPESRVLTGPGSGHCRRGRLTGLHVHQQVGEAAHPRGESSCAALGVVGSLPTLQVLVQQPAQGADAILIWRWGKTSQGRACLQGSGRGWAGQKH